MRVTMMTWRAVGSVMASPRRAPRSTIGSTAPRRLITPRTKLGDWGRGVAAVQPRISRTDMMSTQYSWSPIRNEISSLREESTMFSTLFMTLPCGCHGRHRHGGFKLLGGDHGIDVQDQRDAAIPQDGGGRDPDH